MTDDYREEQHRNSDSCSYCYGSRQIDGKVCPACEGSGAEPEYEDDEYRD